MNNGQPARVEVREATEGEIDTAAAFLVRFFLQRREFPERRKTCRHRADIRQSRAIKPFLSRSQALRFLQRSLWESFGDDIDVCPSAYVKTIIMLVDCRSAPSEHLLESTKVKGVGVDQGSIQIKKQAELRCHTLPPIRQLEPCHADRSPA
jgi:hypothetical protein